MRPEPRITPDAEADTLAAARYYEAERANLGLGFLDEFDHALSLIRATPLLFTLVDDPVRRVLLRRFPYGVFYVSGEERDTILAVVDLRQDPETVRGAYNR
ncbi:MAG: type II toxin-antitoxin system RelE/ParE family toxin [Myxococcales bacterium]|nr:type II toxin-antitoxin system RelE/ParE family toxin [Myxococcales bacterium]